MSPRQQQAGLNALACPSNVLGEPSSLLLANMKLLAGKLWASSEEIRGTCRRTSSIEVSTWSLVMHGGSVGIPKGSWWQARSKTMKQWNEEVFLLTLKVKTPKKYFLPRLVFHAGSERIKPQPLWIQCVNRVLPLSDIYRGQCILYYPYGIHFPPALGLFSDY